MPRLSTAVPKPRKSRTPKKRFSSIRSPSYKERLASAAQQRATRKPIRKVNPEAKARRDARYRKRLGRADWKALRMACFERDGFTCQATDAIGILTFPSGRQYETYGSCYYTDHSKTGKGLVADHKSYRRFGHELLSDLRTLCRSCNARLTRSERANWSGR